MCSQVFIGDVNTKDVTFVFFMVYSQGEVLRIEVTGVELEHQIFVDGLFDLS